MAYLNFVVERERRIKLKLTFYLNLGYICVIQ